MSIAEPRPAASVPLAEEPRGTGVREVLRMAGPVILGSLSYTLMEFADKAMIGRLGTEEFAAAGAASLWSFTLSTFIVGLAGCVSTFAGQSLGRGEPEHCARYAWQGIYLSFLGIGIAAVLWPVAGPLFRLMQHPEAVVEYELVYFRIRLLGYVFLAWASGLAAFFQGVYRPTIPMYAAIFANGANIALNYCLIYGNLGFPRLGIAGAAWATIIAQLLHAGVLQCVFMNAEFHGKYQSRSVWQLDWTRLRELWRVGWPTGCTFLLEVLNWAVFTGFIVGYFGAVALAAQTATISFMHLSFMPAAALNQAVAPIVGRWIGQGDTARAKARTYTAVRLACTYMVGMGLVFALFGGPLINLAFSGDPEVIALGHRLLILAAIFQGFDAIVIVTEGALRGAGDTRWMMWVTLISAYAVFLPLAAVVAILLGGGAFGAWVAGTIYIITLSGLIFRRFHQEKWRDINIFSATEAGTKTEQAAPAAANASPAEQR